MSPAPMGYLSASAFRMLDRQPETSRPPRLAAVPEMAESIAGTVILTIATGWIGGHAIAAALLNRAVLSFLGIGP